jgi:NitT/TauT family transport system substrate-binding protein
VNRHTFCSRLGKVPGRLLAALLLTLAVGVGCGLPIGPFGGTGQKGMLKLRLGVASSPAPALPNSVLWLAKDLGFYEKEGLDVDVVEVQGTPAVITALRAGDLDVGNIATEEAIRLTASKTLELRAIHSPDSRQYFLIAARDSVSKPADLAGKSYAVSRVGSLDHVLSTRVLEAEGVKADSLNLVAIGAPAVRAQALAAGQVDATTMSIGTWITIQRQPGVRIVLGAEEYDAAVPIVQKVDAVTPKVLNEKSEELRRFTAAIIKVSRHFAESPKAWVDALKAKRSDVSAEDLTELYPSFKTAWAVNGIMNVARYQQTADFLYQGEEFKDVSRIQVADWADTKFVDAVLKEIGVYDKYDDPGRPLK